MLDKLVPIMMVWTIFVDMLFDLLHFFGHLTKNNKIDTLFREGPLLVVASGRDTISTASSIKRLALDKVFVVQVRRFNAYFLSSNFF